MEFDTPEALQEYLKEHPNADKSNHSVKKPGGKGDGGWKKPEGISKGHEKNPYNGKALDSMKKNNLTHPRSWNAEALGAEADDDEAKGRDSASDNHGDAVAAHEEAAKEYPKGSPQARYHQEKAKKHLEKAKKLNAERDEEDDS